MSLKSNAFCSGLASSYLFFDGDNDKINTIIQIVLALVSGCIIAGAYFWLRRRKSLLLHGKFSDANSLFIPIYRQVILVYIAVMIACFCISLFHIFYYLSFGENLQSTSLGRVFIAIIVSVSVILPQWQITMMVFLFSKNTISQRAFKRAIKISVPFGLIWYILDVIHEAKPRNLVTNILDIILDCFFLICCFLLLCRQFCSVHARKYSQRSRIITLFVCFAILQMILSITITSLDLNRSDNFCVQQFQFYIWYLVYPFVFFKTVTDDSKYQWTTTTKPLIESTKHTMKNTGFGDYVQNLIWKQNSSIDNNNDENSQYTAVKLTEVQGNRPPSPSASASQSQTLFDKLSQMVSAYCKVIDYHKIEFVKSPAGGNNNGDDDDEKGETVGKGATAKVYRGKYKKQDVAVKCLTKITGSDKKDMSWTDSTLIFRESILSSSLNHPNIVKFLGASLTADAFYLVYEFCSFGDLQQIVIEDCHPNNINIKSVQQRLLYLIDIASGMKCLHDQNFVHRDLKSANVVVAFDKSSSINRYIAKICDFGVSRKLPKSAMKNDVLSFIEKSPSIASLQATSPKGSMQGILPLNIGKSTSIENSRSFSADSNLLLDVMDRQETELESMSVDFTEIQRTIDVGTPAFLAPEILMKLVHKKGVRFHERGKNMDPRVYCDYATDVFSFGMIIWSMVTMKLPYKGYKAMDMILLIRKGKRLKISDSVWQKWDAYVTNLEHLKQLLNKCWAQHSTSRPSFSQICEFLEELTGLKAIDCK